MIVRKRCHGKNGSIVGRKVLSPGLYVTSEQETKLSLALKKADRTASQQTI